ncbi:putative class I-like SAM-binding methyltransferase superfamily, RsmB NOP family protein [Lyophyllum shimeji]|uniref:Class I-like SAM-binding methyltransferase superfamily, RsmB NOP family protein n=1 Tax=Lyophyllum shimeji TaxID=47721 RepID=A0A9P3PQ04_LYOSH|nr:putative class I-like SAM-binding methyltransferase superfamily, RsmB NOP family protein [Lyophyllum shimeji]
MNFYFEAAKTLDRLDAKQGSIKGILATLPDKDRKRTAALVIETLKYKTVLAEVIGQAALLKEEKKKITSLNLALVLVHDLLLAGGIQAGDGPVKQAVLRHKTRLHGEFQKIKIKRGARSNADLAQIGDQRAARIPRYVRVNTLSWTTDEAVESLITRGFTVSKPFESAKGFVIDEHIPDLLCFSPQTAFNEDPFYKAGKIILQDKASCFPAAILAPPANDDSVVIDATAAPGNKTSHLSALMKNKGKLFAFERDKKRFSTLTTMLSRAGCKNVDPLNVDFLTVDPLDPKYHRVTHILLDPSCSGSGIVNRMDHLLETKIEDECDDDRLKRLAAFQLLMVKHAMRFPGVQKIVYSTCSVHAIENEHVVRESLNSDEAKAGLFSLASPNEVLPQWHRRGLPDELEHPSQAASLVRCSPGDDSTNGFFVSCFVRNRHLNDKRKADVMEEQEHQIEGEITHKKRQQKRKRKQNEAT